MSDFKEMWDKAEKAHEHYRSAGLGLAATVITLSCAALYWAVNTYHGSRLPFLLLLPLATAVAHQLFHYLGGMSEARARFDQARTAHLYNVHGQADDQDTKKELRKVLLKTEISEAANFKWHIRFQNCAETSAVIGPLLLMSIVLIFIFFFAPPPETSVGKVEKQKVTTSVEPAPPTMALPSGMGKIGQEASSLKNSSPHSGGRGYR